MTDVTTALSTQLSYDDP